MPITHEIPPNPVENEQAEREAALEAANEPGAVKVRTGRYGELEEHELIHLLDTLDDERSRARFRESVYISLFVYIALGWFLFYGPQVIFHQPRLINPADAIRAHEKELTYLDLPPDVARELAHKPTNKIADKPHTAQTVKPSIDKKTLESLRAARTPAPSPLPPAPQPQQQVASAQPSQPTPTPLPQRAPPQNTPLPSIDAPTPPAAHQLRQLAERGQRHPAGQPRSLPARRGRRGLRSSLRLPRRPEHRCRRSLRH